MDDYLPLSALQHLLFCRRQCALIHIEQLWMENLYTAEGRIVHERVDRGDRSAKGRIKVEYSLPLKSDSLKLVGVADVVEFHPQKGKSGPRPFPVEYKRGRPKKDLSDKVQLCAQALCMEEMFNTSIAAGALFYGKARRRLDVVIDEQLRGKTITAAEELHTLFMSGKTPQSVYGKKCDNCSFFDLCLPRTVEKKRKVSTWLKRIVEE